uniref:hypothetical protein n=1 Tax=Aliarcobacter sp. TaxID=2321116 RepID=UPI004048CE03
MNIYIYGNQSFKKDIHETLEHSNIKFKLDNNSMIQEISDLAQLKEIIKSNPKDIYLIDDEKIIKKNSFNKKLKFLMPKDGIEEEFLLDNGIADLSVDSLKEIPKYILKKYEEEKKLEPDIHESIIDIVDEAYEKDNIKSSNLNINIQSKDKIEDLDFDVDNIELDDELAQLLGKEEKPSNKSGNEVLGDIENLIGFEPEEENINNNKDDISLDEFQDIMNFNDNFGLNNISFDYDDDDILNNQSVEKEKDIDLSSVDSDVFENLDFVEDFDSKKEEISDINDKIIDKSLQGSNMSDEFFELDSLNENDLLDALSGMGDLPLSNNEPVQTKTPEIKDNATLNINSSSTEELASLISKLLNNKTLEITIKIKD